MYTVTIDTPTKATITQAANLFINGRLTVANPYKEQKKIIVGSSYEISTEAVKQEITIGNSYTVSGSWIRDVLHVTSMHPIAA